MEKTFILSNFFLIKNNCYIELKEGWSSDWDKEEIEEMKMGICKVKGSERSEEIIY